MAERIRPEERQFNLVLAMLATRDGMTRDAIFETVRGYAEARQANAASLARMFERDKALLRDAGVPLITIPDPFEPENNQLTRYRISTSGQDTDALPDFTPEELALVTLAIAVWHHGTNSSTARNLLAKLRAANIPISATALDAPTGLRGPAPIADTINRAIADHQQLTFHYTTQGFETAIVRHVLPFALVTQQERLLLYGWDLDRDDHRTFLLDRMSEPIKARDYRGNISWPSNPLDEATKALQDAQRDATLLIRAGSTAAVLFSKLGRQVNDGLFEVPFIDRTHMATLIASFGEDVVAQGPSDLRAEVVRQLTLIKQLHEETSSWPDAQPPVHETSTNHAPDPVVLLMSLVPYLLQHPAVPEESVANEFGTDVATIRRAINTLAVSGVPGESAMYDPQDLFDIDWDAWEQQHVISLTHTVGPQSLPQLSASERSAIIVALHMLAATLTSQQAASALAAARKLGAEDTIPTPPIPVDHELTQVRTAISEHRRLRLRYVTADERVTERFVDPASLDLIAHQWYLRGTSYTLDGELQGERTFRLDRVDALQITAIPIAPRPSQDTLASLLGDSKIIHVVEGQRHGDQRTVSSREIAGVAAYLRSVASSGGSRVIVQPTALRAQLAEQATRALQPYLSAAGSSAPSNGRQG